MSNIYEELSKSIVEEVSKGKDVNSLLKKTAKENNLNKEGTQRLVEETNINLFLNKMQDGTQYEDFDLARPVTNGEDKPESIGGHATLDKEASLSINISPSMFNLNEDNTSMESFDGNTHSSSLNDYMFTSEMKWEDAELEKRAMWEEEEEHRRHAKAVSASDNFISNLSYEIRGDADLIKTAISITHEEDRPFIDEVLENSTITKGEILDGEISEDSMQRLEKLARSIFDESFDGILKTAKDKGKTGNKFLNSVASTTKDLSGILSFPFRHPKTTVALVGAGYVGNKSINNNREIEERNKMIEEGQG